MTSRFLLLASVALAVLTLPACGPAPLDGRTWSPVTDVEDEGGRGAGLTLRLPGDRGPALTERVDPEKYLIVGVHYDGCHWADPALVGVGGERLEVQLVELMRECVRPIPRIAWFAVKWAELPTEFRIIDQSGSTTTIRDRRRG